MTCENPAPGAPFSTECGLPSVEHYPENNTFRSQFNSPTVTPSEAVISTVAVATEQNPADIPSLYSAIDPDALDALCTSTNARPVSPDGCVRFEYADCRVTVENQGTVLVDPATEPPDEAE